VSCYFGFGSARDKCGSCVSWIKEPKRHHTHGHRASITLCNSLAESARRGLIITIKPENVNDKILDAKYVGELNVASGDGQTNRGAGVSVKLIL